MLIIHGFRHEAPELDGDDWANGNGVSSPKKAAAGGSVEAVAEGIQLED
jgi:hypothetical protein